MKTKSTLELRLEALEQQVKNLTECPWVTLGELAGFVGMSRPRIVQEINEAEKARAMKKQPRLIRGEHYYNAASESSIKPSWRIHKDKFVAAIAGYENS